MDKVSSSISYVDGKPQKWGYMVGLTDEPFKWIKLLLDENNMLATGAEMVTDSNQMLTKMDKRAHEVVADYLKLLWDYTLQHIQKLYPKFQDMFNLRVILTVPAIWSPAATDRMLQVARLAGMPAPINLITEPEAAALATIDDIAEAKRLRVSGWKCNTLIEKSAHLCHCQVGDAFIVCDAGGALVVSDQAFDPAA